MDICNKKHRDESNPCGRNWRNSRWEIFAKGESTTWLKSPSYFLSHLDFRMMGWRFGKDVEYGTIWTYGYAEVQRHTYIYICIHTQ